MVGAEGLKTLIQSLEQNPCAHTVMKKLRLHDKKLLSFLSGIRHQHWIAVYNIQRTIIPRILQITVRIQLLETRRDCVRGLKPRASLL